MCSWETAKARGPGYRLLKSEPPTRPWTPNIRPGKAAPEGGKTRRRSEMPCLLLWTSSHPPHSPHPPRPRHRRRLRPNRPRSTRSARRPLPPQPDQACSSPKPLQRPWRREPSPGPSFALRRALPAWPPGTKHKVSLDSGHVCEETLESNLKPKERKNVPEISRMFDPHETYVLISIARRTPRQKWPLIRGPKIPGRERSKAKVRNTLVTSLCAKSDLLLDSGSSRSHHVLQPVLHDRKDLEPKWLRKRCPGTRPI